MIKIIKNVFTIRTVSAQGRVEQIDFLRGVAMLLVLLHHSGFPLGDYILAFHMPLFFVLTGYLKYISRGEQRPIKIFLERRFKRLVVPYFIFEILNLIIWCSMCILKQQSFPEISETLIGIISCINNNYIGLYGRLWFLPCMFMADLYVWVILKFWKGNRFAQILSILILFILSFFTNKFIPLRLPFTIDTAFFAASFIMLGYVFGDVIQILLDKGNDICKTLLGIVSFLFLIYAVRYTDVAILMYDNHYGEYTVSICAAISGIIIFLVFGCYLYKVLSSSKFINGFVLWYGNNSLATFPVHLTIKMFILWYVPALSRWYLLFLVMFFLNIPIVNAIRYYFPIMLGQKH